VIPWSYSRLGFASEKQRPRVSPWWLAAAAINAGAINAMVLVLQELVLQMWWLAAAAVNAGAINATNANPPEHYWRVEVAAANHTGEFVLVLLMSCHHIQIFSPAC
jgi:hypothetical protein